MLAVVDRAGPKTSCLSVGCALASRSFLPIAATLWLFGAPALGQAGAVPATAQASPSEREYKESIRRALAEMDARNYAEARSLFLKAHALQPSARTLRALGNVEFELRRYAQSMRYLRAALANDVRPLTAEMKLEVNQALERALGFTGRFALELAPKNATLTIDEQPAELEGDGTLLLDVGRHELVLKASGYLSTQKSLMVNGSENDTLRIALTPIGLAQPSLVAHSGGDQSTPQPSGAAATEDRSVFRQWWFWTALGVVATGAVTGIVLASSGGGTQTSLAGNLGQTRQLLRLGP